MSTVLSRSRCFAADCCAEHYSGSGDDTRRDTATLAVVRSGVGDGSRFGRRPDMGVCRRPVYRSVFSQPAGYQFAGIDDRRPSGNDIATKHCSQSVLSR